MGCTRDYADNAHYRKTLTDAGFTRKQVDAIIEVANSIARAKMLAVAEAARMGPR